MATNISFTWRMSGDLFTQPVPSGFRPLETGNFWSSLGSTVLGSDSCRQTQFFEYLTSILVSSDLIRDDLLFGDVQDALNYSEDLSGTRKARPELVDIVTLTESLIGNAIPSIVESLAVSSLLEANISITQGVIDRTEIAETMIAVWRVSLAEAVSVALDTYISTNSLSDLTETLSVEDRINIRILLFLDSIATLSSALANGAVETLSDSVTAQIAPSLIRNAREYSDFVVALSHSLVGTRSTSADLIETFSSVDEFDSLARLVAVLTSPLDAETGLVFISPTESYVVGVQTGSGAQWTDVEFLYADPTWVVRSDGVYAWDFDVPVDDHGDPIQILLDLGWVEPGGMRVTRVDRAYVSASGSGDMILRLWVDDDRSFTEARYRLQVQQTRPETTRVAVGRGLSARRWRVEVRSAAGAEISVLEDVILEVVPTGRRVQ